MSDKVKFPNWNLSTYGQHDDDNVEFLGYNDKLMTFFRLILNPISTASCSHGWNLSSLVCLYVSMKRHNLQFMYVLWRQAITTFDTCTYTYEVTQLGLCMHVQLIDTMKQMQVGEWLKRDFLYWNGCQEPDEIILLHLGVTLQVVGLFSHPTQKHIRIMFHCWYQCVNVLTYL